MVKKVCRLDSHIKGKKIHSWPACFGEKIKSIVSFPKPIRMAALSTDELSFTLEILCRLLDRKFYITAS
jgi:hypothetical protein